MPEPYAETLATVAAGRTALVARLRTIAARRFRSTRSPRSWYSSSRRWPISAARPTRVPSMEMQSFRSRALAGVVLLALLALLGEAFERIDRFGLSASALGPWHQRPDWNAVYSTGPEGHARPIPGSWARWALSAGEPLIDYRFDDHGLRVPAGGGRSPALGACRVLVIG